MTDLIDVVSNVHCAIKIADEYDPKNKDADLASAVIYGGNHPEAVNGEMVTRGVDAGLFHRWLDKMKESRSALANMVREKTPERVSAPVADEPGDADVAPEGKPAEATDTHSPDQAPLKPAVDESPHET